MRLLFAGTPATAVPSLDALLASQHDVVAVLTRPDAPAGRGRHLRPSPVAERAAAAGLQVIKASTLRAPETLDQLRQVRPDCAPVVAFGALVPPAALDIPRHGWVNLHFSLLPAWRGAAPVQHALLHGDDVTGATTFQLDEGLDTGPVLGLLTEAVRPTDTTGDLLERLAHAGAGLLVATLDALERGELTAQPQPAEGVSLAPKLTREDARVDWSAPAFHIDRQVRACTPAPGAWTTWGDDRVGLGPVTVLDTPDGDTLAPGALRVGRAAVLVGAGDGRAVRLGEVRPPGKKAMAADAWARGVRDLDGARFG
ncbi:MAG: methionyl-tRNA formyltransferase [Actinomycetes bacterium]